MDLAKSSRCLWRTTILCRPIISMSRRLSDLVLLRLSTQAPEQSRAAPKVPWSRAGGQRNLPVMRVPHVGYEFLTLIFGPCGRALRAEAQRGLVCNPVENNRWSLDCWPKFMLSVLFTRRKSRRRRWTQRALPSSAVLIFFLANTAPINKHPRLKCWLKPPRTDCESSFRPNISCFFHVSWHPDEGEAEAFEGRRAKTGESRWFSPV